MMPNIFWIEQGSFCFLGAMPQGLILQAFSLMIFVGIHDGKF
jgi:hypothetical protein